MHFKTGYTTTNKMISSQAVFFCSKQTPQLDVIQLVDKDGWNGSWRSWENVSY